MQKAYKIYFENGVSQKKGNIKLVIVNVDIINYANNLYKGKVQFFQKLKLVLFICLNTLGLKKLVREPSIL